MIGEGEQAGVPLEVVAQHTAGSLLMLLKWWLGHEMPCSAEEMNGFFQQLVMPGICQMMRGGDESV